MSIIKITGNRFLVHHWTPRTTTGGSLECDFCGWLVAESACLSADIKKPCKLTSEPNKHHWLVETKLSSKYPCMVCTDENCNQKCSWCSRTVHEACLSSSLMSPCDFGKVFLVIYVFYETLTSVQFKLKDCIVPPYCIQRSDAKNRSSWTRQLLHFQRLEAVDSVFANYDHNML